MDTDLQTLDPKTGKPPETRIKDCASLNTVVERIIKDDDQSAINRIDVQKSLDGAPPLNDDYIRQSGQDGRCNLNFGDMKARVKLEVAGYYDLTESVPTLAYIYTDFGDPTERQYYNAVMSEEFHRLLKEWKEFDNRFQLLVQKFVTHGLGFNYFKDDVDWRWEVAGLDDFKVPRATSLSEDDCDIALVLRDVPVTKLYKWTKDVEASDKRWNLDEVHKAIMNATPDRPTDWSKFQEMIKNNDVAISVGSENVKLVQAWVREFSGKISIYWTLRGGGNQDYLFKAENISECVNECFTYFPYEVGTNGKLHSVRGLAHEIYAAVQVINSLKCQAVDNAKLSGSLLLQPNTETDAEDMAILFYAGAAYLPPNIKVQNATLANPTNNLLPVLEEMSLSLRSNSGDTNTQARNASQREKTKFEVQGEMTKEGVLPTANMNLFYQPWGRHISEVWRRVSNKALRKSDPGAEMVFEMRKRIVERNVPEDAIYAAKRVIPCRAVGYGSPTQRLMALDEFMQYYGSLDPVGQNNLLRDRFAQRVGYGQVDRYVPRIEEGGRAPVDIEIAELQNTAMDAGKVMSVRPNDHHILHLQVHFPSIDQDLLLMEGGKGSPELFGVIKIKIDHITGHMQTLKPDKLNKAAVADMQKVYNNTAERVQAAERALAVQAEKAATQAQNHTVDQQIKIEDHRIDQQIKMEEHQLAMRLDAEEAAQKRATTDAKTAAQLRAKLTSERLSAGAAPPPNAPEAITLPAPAR